MADLQPCEPFDGKKLPNVHTFPHLFDGMDTMFTDSIHTALPRTDYSTGEGPRKSMENGRNAVERLPACA
jgi:hypothetical protein